MRSIEKLALWLIPAELLAIILPSVITFVTAGVSPLPGSRSLVSLLMALSSLTYLIGHFVIGMWLLYQPHKVGSSRWIWFFFGLVAGYWALGIYLLVQIPAISSALQPGGSSEAPLSNA